ncbi:type VI secretion system contractile sheath small subunit [Klebsiella oxytoca]|uniref:type VI secretion system contractile sheath small subunit n=4 Tax=Klebsiella oxytoca TaxID=571 RepID=UPI00265EE91F|nr:type VI secretion system contractile sheath small subunit [Klebsiella oxytoca]WKM79912.1 type VI secretion system contractile sheath small subunit [Klebsiella oxytoca]
MGNSFQNEVPKSRVNLQLDLHTGGAGKKSELPLKLLAVGDFSNGKEQRSLSERNKININKNNFDSVMAEAELLPTVDLLVESTLSGEARVENIKLNFGSVKDFEPEQVARNIPSLRALISMRNLLRDLKSNLLDNVEFRRELEKIMKDPAMSSELRAELTALAP